MIATKTIIVVAFMMCLAEDYNVNIKPIINIRPIKCRHAFAFGSTRRYMMASIVQLRLSKPAIIK